MTMPAKLARSCALLIILTAAALVPTVALPERGLGGTPTAAGQAIAPVWRLTGTWVVTVTRENPPANAPPTFESLMTFTSDGGMLETSNTGTTLRGPAHGAWTRTGPRQFETSMLFYRFNPATGAFLGSQQVHRTMTLSRDQMRFTATSVAEQYNPDGSLAIGGLRATESGRLFFAGHVVHDR
jgi:hypothetical protein